MTSPRTLFLAALVSARMAAAAPEQVRLALAGSHVSADTHGVRVSWFTADKTASSTVRIGTSPDALDRTETGSHTSYSPILEDWGYHHTVKVDGLTKASEYFYSCGDESDGFSEVFSFSTAPDSTDTDFSVVAFGDHGYLGSSERPIADVTIPFGIEKNWTGVPTRELVESLKDSNQMDALWILGDIGYPDDAFCHKQEVMHMDYEDIYNDYVNWFQNISSTMPMHVSVGNHESECHSPSCVVHYERYGRTLSNFTAYNQRWSMPSPESGGVLNMWYSWDFGSAHFISIDTSTDFVGAPEGEKGDSGIFPAGSFGREGEYLEWLEADLAAAAADPDIKWIIAGGHRPLHDFNTTILGPLFEEYGVDLYLCGHAHSYSRYELGKHVDGVVEVVVGGAGNDEMVWVETSTFNDPDAVFSTNVLAIGKLTVSSADGGSLTWQLLASESGEVIDTVTITK